MADSEKRGSAGDDGSPDNSSPPSHTERRQLELPSGWKYHSLKIGPFHTPWYASPRVQLVVVALVCFLCPGMFNALGGLGGGGQVSASAVDKANTALYSTFAVVSFFAGTFTNKLGVKTALCFGGLGYSVYVASFLCYNHTQNEGFSIFAGALLGVCAGLLWTAQGAIMMSYPREASKGKYISWFWTIFNLGGVIGSLIPLGQNIHVKTASAVNDGTYIGFLVLTFLGAMSAWLLVNTKDVIRADGSKVIIMKNPTWKSELIGLWETLQSDIYIVLLFPMFFASNWFYTYQQNDVNAARFDTRTRALNSTLYWFSQIIGSLLFGYFLDMPVLRRATRAKVGWCILFLLTMAIWGGGYAFQAGIVRADVPPQNKDYMPIDWTTSGFVGPMFLYMFYGFFDAAWQVSVYWFMGALTNNGRKLANFAGFYKGIQSAGAAIMFRLDLNMTPFMTMFALCWGVIGGSLLIAIPVIFFKIRDHVPIEEDLKFSDETLADVAPVIEADGGTPEVKV